MISVFGASVISGQQLGFGEDVRDSAQRYVSLCITTAYMIDCI